MFEPLSDDETRFFLDHRWGHRVSVHSNDFTDQEAVATILRITNGGAFQLTVLTPSSL